jgi:hypothetical protein
MGLHEVLIAFAFGADNWLMVALQAVDLAT